MRDQFFSSICQVIAFSQVFVIPFIAKKKKKKKILCLHKLQKYKPLHLERFLKLLLLKKNKIRNDDDSKHSGYYLDILNEYQELF